jgi:DNA-directed RNA polymerase subunit RPC12/RpoP
VPSKYASGKKSIAECDRCGFRFMLKELKTLTIKTKNVNIKVCKTKPLKSMYCSSVVLGERRRN